MPPTRTPRGNKERRSARRFDLSLPIAVRTVPPQRADPLIGRTRDISTCSLYFTIDREFMPGSKLDLTLTLPAELTPGTEVFVRVHGKVVRAEKNRGKGIEYIGVAAVIERYDIVRVEPSIF